MRYNIGDDEDTELFSEHRTPGGAVRNVVTEAPRSASFQILPPKQAEVFRTPKNVTRAALYSVQLCRENAVNADWSVLVYATKLQCATRRITLAILSRDKVARQNRAIKSQV